MTQDKTVMVGCRVKPEVEARIKKLAVEMGVNSSRLIWNAIPQYLGDEVAPSPVDRLHELEQTVAALNRRISQLAQSEQSEENGMGIETIRQDVADLRDRINQMSTPQFRPKCPDCRWHQPRKNGHDQEGRQQWVCNRCGRTWYDR